METQLFRQKSMEHISSPEALRDYMRVTSPRIWMLLAAILALLAGFLFYSSTVTLEESIPLKATVDHYDLGEGEIYTSVLATLSLDQQDLVKPGMSVRIGTETGTVSTLYVTEEEGVGLIIQLEGESASALPDGTYDAELITDSTTAIGFLFN